MRRVWPIVKRAYELSLDIDADRFEADGPYDPLKTGVMSRQFTLESAAPESRRSRQNRFI